MVDKYKPKIICAECGKELYKGYHCRYCDCTLCFDCWDAHEDQCCDPGEGIHHTDSEEDYDEEEE